MTSASPYDLVICGAGMVGATLACALISSPLKIAVIEAKATDFGTHPGFDSRAIALSYGSLAILEQLGLGQDFAQHGTAIKTIHISDRGHFGLSTLSHDEYHVNELGSVIELQNAGRILHAKLAQADNISLLCPQSPAHISRQQEHILLTMQDGQRLQTKLLIGADGAQSRVNELLNIGRIQHNFGQAAVIANVRSTEPHLNRAFERFTDTGPMALLPLGEERWSLVWSIPEEQQSEFAQLSDPAFLARLQSRFGQRVGRFIQTGKRSIYPLQLIEAKQAVSHRVVLLGNAAHQLHPVAGQGYNLGLRDLFALAQTIQQAIKQQQDIGGFCCLSTYNKQREQDTRRTIAVTSALATLFTSQQTAIIATRNIGLSLLQYSPLIKNSFAWAMMGKD